MEVRTVKVAAPDRRAAGEAAITASRRERFDPLRVIEAKCLGLLEMDEAPRFLYEVSIQGVPLEENEARFLYGDR